MRRPRVLTVLLVSGSMASCIDNRIITDNEMPACNPDTEDCQPDMGGGWMGRDGGGFIISSACSSDLQSVLDRDGNVIRMCPPDQGCNSGQFVPACSAAAASAGSIGCDFYAPDPPFYKNGEGSTFDGACYAVFVANTWSRPAQIKVTRGGQTFDVTQFGRIPSGILPNITYDPIPPTGVPPNQVAVLFL